jgi:hypothetical protein
VRNRRKKKNPRYKWGVFTAGMRRFDHKKLGTSKHICI